MSLFWSRKQRRQASSKENESIKSAERLENAAILRDCGIFQIAAEEISKSKESGIPQLRKKEEIAGILKIGKKKGQQISQENEKFRYNKQKYPLEYTILRKF